MPVSTRAAEASRQADGSPGCVGGGGGGVGFRHAAEGERRVRSQEMEKNSLV